MKKIIKLLLVFVLLTVLAGMSVSAATFDTENFTGLVLTADSGVKIKLYAGFDPDAATLVNPVYTQGNTQYYAVSAGRYYYNVSGTGYYTIKKNLYLTNEKLAVKTVLDVTPGKKANVGGWEPALSTIQQDTDEVLQNVMPSDRLLWPEYADIFVTPAFGEGRAEHLTTTQSEMEAFIAELDDGQDNMYVYSAGTSPYGHDIPLVIFTRVDLSGAKTLEEAAALIRTDSENNNKLIVHHQAYMHGSEPAAGEAALAMLVRLDGSYGEKVLDSMNVYVMPRLNPDGSQKNMRNIVTFNNKDPNRDLLALETVEMTALVRVMNLFDPHVLLDNHEYAINTTDISKIHTDMLFCAYFGVENSDAFSKLAVDVAQESFRALDAEGLTYNYYTSVVNGRGRATSTGYARYRGILSFLMESRGIYFGSTNYERRVVGHMICLTTIYDHLAENTQYVKETVETEKKRIVENGKTFEVSDILVMETESAPRSEYKIPVKTFAMDSGALKSTSFLTPKAHDMNTIIRSRPAPTAYVIPDGEDFVEQLLKLMDKHGISYSRLPEGASVLLRQYTGTTANVSLAAESAATFPNGAYVFSMAQPMGYVLAGLMEPDMAYTGGGTREAVGIAESESGVFPLYRYERNLNAQGTVDTVTLRPAPVVSAESATSVGGVGAIAGLDPEELYEYRRAEDTAYTQVAAGSSRIEGLRAGTYYVRFRAADGSVMGADAMVNITYQLDSYVVFLHSALGKDTNNGLTEGAPLATLDQAYKKLSQLMTHAPKGTVGTILLLDTYRLPDAKAELPACDFPVCIAGKTGAEGFVFKGGTINGNRVIAINSETTFENMTFTLISDSDQNYISGKGHKLVIGKNVTCVANSIGAYFNVTGGDYKANFASTDVTVLSGTWRNVYAGSYTKSTIKGDVRLTIDGAHVTHVIRGAYSGDIMGNVYMDISNVTGGTSIYAGTASDGSVGGDITVRLGENVDIPVFYAGAQTQISGSMTVIADGVDLTKLAVYGATSNAAGKLNGAVLELRSGELADVLDAFVQRGDALVRLGCTQTKPVTVSKNFLLDLNGNEMSGAVNVAEGVILTCIDSATADYDISDGVLGRIAKVEGIGNVVGAEATETSDVYLKLEDAPNVNVSFHAVSLNIESMALRAEDAGIYFCNRFAGDAMVAQQVESFGVVLSVDGAPTEENMYTPARFTSFSADKFESDAQHTSSLLYGIMKPANNVSTNSSNGDMQVYGRAYIRLKNGEHLFGCVRMRSLRTQVELIDDQWESLGSQSVIDMYKIYTDAMQAWDIPNIIRAAG